MVRHLVYSVRGLLGRKNKDLKGIFLADGKPMTAGEIREYLYDKLSEGYEVIPVGKECEGFDKKKGCPGHVKK